MTELETILNRLERVQRISSRVHFAKCPTDRHPEIANCTLVVFEPVADEIVLRCHGGCPPKEVLRALRSDKTARDFVL